MPAAPHNRLLQEPAESGIGPHLIIMTKLQADDPALAILPHPCQRVHAVRMIRRQQDVIVAPGIAHEIGFVRHRPISKASRDRMRRIGHRQRHLLIV